MGFGRLLFKECLFLFYDVTEKREAGGLIEGSNRKIEQSNHKRREAGGLIEGSNRKNSSKT
jgi:hypothetical protein